MSEKITVTYYISDDGWIYTDSFGVAMLEGRADREVGITEQFGRRILTLPREVDGMEVYIVSFDAEYDDTVTDLVIPGGVGIIGPKAFCGWRKLRRLSIPASVQEISEGTFSGTAIPRRVQRELYRRTLPVSSKP